MDNESFLTVADELDIPFEEVVIGLRPGSATVQLSFLNEAAAPVTLAFTSPAEAAAAACHLASAKAGGEDASVADLKGILEGHAASAA